VLGDLRTNYLSKKKKSTQIFSPGIPSKTSGFFSKKRRIATLCNFLKGHAMMKKEKPKMGET